MKIILDNLIFSLQKAGGISVLWKEHLQRLQLNDSLNLNFINYPNDNIFSQKLDFKDKSIIRKHLPLMFSRYLNVKLDKQKSIFHSSYYRVSTTKYIKNITTVHDFTYEYFGKGISKKIHSFQKEYAIKKSSGIICVSENTKKDLLHFNPKIKESSIKVIHNGVSNEFLILKNLNGKNLKSLIKFESKSYILYVGDRKAKYKNFKIAVISSKIIGLPLVIVGGGVLRSNEKKLLDYYLKDYNFSHLSHISNSDLNVLYNNAFCLLYPSSYEGFGIPIIEAQKAGCPVISSNVSSIPEIANDSALLIDNISVNCIVSCMRNLLNESYLSESIIKKGLSNSKRFSWDKTYNETMDFYKKIYNG
jgi:glycosyltransferase involved in cell wall biosynthesis